MVTPTGLGRRGWEAGSSEEALVRRCFEGRARTTWLERQVLEGGCCEGSAYRGSVVGTGGGGVGAGGKELGVRG